MNGRRTMLAIGAMAAMLSVARAQSSPVTLRATIDARQEVPAPTGTNSGEGGAATFTFDQSTLALQYDITLHDLTSDPLAGHIHRGAPGLAPPDNVVVGLPILPPANGEAQGSVNLPESAVQALFDGGLYVNFHTAANGAGEVRGQIRPTGGACPCAAPDFKKCVRERIRALAKAERKAAGVTLLKRLVKKASCRAATRKKRVGCCLPGDPVENIVSDRMCGLVPEKLCTRLTGISRGAGSSCATACSPSGAFLDAAAP